MEETDPHRRTDGFDALIDEIRAKLLPALVAKWGIEVGSDQCQMPTVTTTDNSDAIGIDLWKIFCKTDPCNDVVLFHPK